MSLSNALSALRTAIEAVGLHATENTNDSSLLAAGRGDLDGSYLLRVASGVRIYPELKMAPEAFVVALDLEMGTVLESDEDFADSQLQAAYRSQQVAQAVIASNHNDVVNISQLGTSTVQTQGRKQVTTMRFNLVYREQVSP